MSRVAEIARAMRAMRKARERERWPQERMREHQRGALDALVRHAIRHSPLHRERLREGAPLEELPVLDKATLMERFDDALCDPRLRGGDLRTHLHDADPLDGEHRVMASSGSTGTPSLYVYSRADWTGLLAQFFRYSEFVGVRPRVPRLRVAAIGAPTLASMTQKVSRSVDVGLHRILALSVSDPLPRLVEQLNAFRPEVLNAYPSIACLLADEQLAGRLRIAPRVLSTSSELRTPEMTARIERAFGVRAFDFYATSEGLWGIDCEHHDGIHLFEDWCIVEDFGDRLLVTNLFNRTLPLIRFEVSDVVTIERGTCACGRTLPRLRAVQGRAADVLRFGDVAVHPTQFSLITADPGVREFQIVQQNAGVALRLALREDASSDTAERVAQAVRERLAGLGVTAPAVTAEVVPAIERTAAGKLQLVVSEP